MSQSFEEDDDFVIPLEMQQTYWLRRQDDFNKLETALQNNTPEVFRKVGHQIKGNAITFGFAELSQLGMRMEDMPSEDFLKIAPTLLLEFKNWIEKTEPILNSK